MRMKRKRSSDEANAEIFTPPVIVSFMLRSVEARLGAQISFRHRVLEPSAGEGAFVFALVKRALAQGNCDWSDPTLDDFLCAVEINPAFVAHMRTELPKLLIASGCPSKRAHGLSEHWIRQGDFLREPLSVPFDVVIGNPPYVRYDAIPDEDVKYYRAHYRTFAGRCDLYVPFIERGVSLLAPNGVFSFICSNRFAKTEYGVRLRNFLTSWHHVDLFLNLEHAEVFGRDVAAYPAILVVDRRTNEPTYATTVSKLTDDKLDAMLKPTRPGLAKFEQWYSGEMPWMTTDKKEYAYIQKIQRHFPTLEDSADGTSLGIGIATGCDDVFVRDTMDASIEAEQQMPLIVADDVRDGMKWSGHYLVSPFDESQGGELIHLEQRPGTSAYFKSKESRLRARYIARSRDAQWFRTIDRVRYDVFRSPKILIPDIQSGGILGVDAHGAYYPHHNLYWIVAPKWNLAALAAILSSDFVASQIRWQSSELRGGSIRYQVKNLSSVHIPPASACRPDEIDELSKAWERRDTHGINRLVSELVARCLDV